MTITMDNCTPLSVSRVNKPEVMVLAGRELTFQDSIQIYCNIIFTCGQISQVTLSKATNQAKALSLLLYLNVEALRLNTNNTKRDYRLNLLNLI